MTISNINDDPLFDTPGAAEYLLSSVPTMERWRRVGQGPDFCKMSGLVRYQKSALDRYIEASTRRASRVQRTRHNEHEIAR